MVPDEFRFWILIGGAAIYTFLRSAADMRLWQRLLFTMSSTGLGIGLGPEFGAFTGLGEAAGTGLIIMFGIIVLDVVHSIITQTNFVESFMRSRAGLPAVPPESEVKDDSHDAS